MFWPNVNKVRKKKTNEEALNDPAIIRKKQETP